MGPLDGMIAEAEPGQSTKMNSPLIHWEAGESTEVDDTRDDNKIRGAIAKIGKNLFSRETAASLRIETKYT